MVEGLMDLHGVINRDFEAEQHDVRKKITNKSLLTTTTGHLLAFATDYEARSRAVIAQMIHDGSLDAFTYDVSTGKAVYNPKKDGRFWSIDKNLKTTQSEDQRLLWEDHIAEMKKDDVKGSFNEDGTPKRAYTLRELQLLTKLGDEIVGAFTRENKPLVMNQLIAFLAFQFKNFLPTKAAQRFGVEKPGEVYTWKQVVTDEDGTKHVIEQKVNTYGAFTKSMQYFTRFSKQAVKSRSLNVSMNATEDEKYALAAAGFDIVVWGAITIMLGMVNFGGEDKDKKEASVFSLGFVKNAIKGFNSYTILNPLNMIQMFGELPILGTAKRMFKMVSGQGSWSEFRRLVPGGGTQKMITDIHDFMDDDNIKE
jgi:hypothetical protein